MKLSIIIPTVGRKTLPKALEALRSCDQYIEINPEVIVVFDGEKPGEYEGIQVLETGEKVYAGGARNLGLDNATGDIIIFLQDDTYPEKSWLKKHYDFHQQNEEKGSVLLGKVEWTEKLAKDPFHKWLLNHAQFRFHKIKRHGATWKNFYTSNISLKRDLIGETRFSDQFKGWGFEDIEFGYRVSNQHATFHIEYNGSCVVFHDHPQTLESVLENTRNARRNAHKFEQIHSKVKILPRGLKLFTLWSATLFLSIFSASHLSKKTYWWREWKKAWIKG